MDNVRLINANTLIEESKKSLKLVQKCRYYTAEDALRHFLLLIDEQSTAYDIDNVVKELIDHTQECTDRTTYETHSFVPLFDAIKIVKKGGSDE
jgi:hypothetical protein